MLSAAIITAALFFTSCASAPAPAPASQEIAQAAVSPAAPTTSSARARAEELVKGEMGTPKPATASPAPTSAATDSATAEPAEDVITTTTEEEEVAIGITAKEKQFFEAYLKRLKYMMVLKEGSGVTDFQARMILTKGNEHLLKQGYDVVHYDQVQKNMEDQRTAYEAEAGQAMSLTQYIAQKLGADVYVELDAVPRSFSDGNKHYGEANFAANMYDPSTAELLGSITYRTDRSFSTSSEDDALLNALTAGTAQFMPRIIKDSTTVLRNRYANGIRYQLILQSTADSRAVSTFRRNIRSRVREIVMGPSAADQTVMDVYMFGTLADLEDACYLAFEKTPGMESAYWVYTRGKTITFNTGN